MPARTHTSNGLLCIALHTALCTATWGSGCGARSEDRLDPDAGASEQPLPADAVDAGPCGPVHVQCDGLCIDPARDAQFCGATNPCTGQRVGSVCEPEHACIDGRCERVCPAGRTPCLGRCIDPLGDDAHCGATDCAAGAVGVACDPWERCGRGACVPRCEPGLVACDGDCIDPLRDPGRCGARGHCIDDDTGQRCDAGRVCVGGACTAGCPAGYVECAQRCVDPYADDAHCGARDGCEGPAAGETCTAGQRCVLGKCGLACPPELLACGERCVDPRYDPEYCGADGDCRDGRAGERCADDQYCDLGACRASCPPGQLSCEGGCTDPLSDPNHCGAAGDCSGPLRGDVCPLPQVCSAGSCVDACPVGSIACDGGCIDPGSSRTHCGASGDCTGPLSGAQCGPLDNCVDGACTPGCGGALRRCAGLCTDVLHDRFHCGGCGQTCAPGQDCFDGSCGGLCPEPAPGDRAAVLCDGQCIDPQTDPRHCGARGLCVGVDAGVPCQESELCTDGVCDPICEFAFCGGQCTDISVHPDNCGACNRACADEARCSDGTCSCVIHVRTDGDDGASGASWGSAKRTLLAALEAARAGGCAVWVAQGVYRLDDADRGATVLLEAATRLYGGFAGDELRLDARDVAAHPTRIEGDIGTPRDGTDNTATLVTCIAELGCDADSVIDGFTLQGAWERAMVIEGADPTVRAVTFRDNLGGGLRIEGGAPSIEGCLFADNFATDGGGARVLAGAPRLSDTTFANNFAAHNGGGLYVEAAAQPTLQRLHFAANFAQQGGGLYTDQTAWVQDSSFADNRAQRGGAIHGPVVVADCELSRNEASSGGAIYSTRSLVLTRTRFVQNATGVSGGAVNLVAPAQLETLVADRCLWQGNRAQLGGGILHDSAAEIAIDNSQFLSNEAIAGAGIVKRGSGPLRVGTTTFVGQRADNGYGGAIEQSAGAARIDNCILWDNGPEPLRLTPGNARTSHSLVQGGCGPQCGAAIAILDADPRLMSPGAGDLRLHADSPCIDAGDDGAVPPQALLDFDGRPRIVDGPDDDGVATVDMGAYEYSP